MSRPDDLKLIALDPEDLTVISAHVQDAVMKVANLAYEAGRQRFSLTMNRFAWEASSRRSRGFERRRAMLHFDRVQKVESTRLNRGAPDVVLELLAISFAAAESPAGAIVLHFAGGPEIRLSVECIEAQLADLGAAWQTKARPAHDLPA